jgi:serine/threonine-protein kinase
MTISALGPYRLTEVLGRGGMGTVYLGVEEETNRRVAVKVLTPVFASERGFRDRFQSEIRSLEKLRHPNIVQLYGYGEQDGHLYYAMELVSGESLQDELVAGRRFDWREVCRIGQAVCSALKHAHDHGIIHRDIKPANLLLDERDIVKLSDFGIAKLFGNAQLTVDGGVLGTADYMPPEQAEGLAATPRCDLYSLGAVMYALLSGRPPFRGKSVPEVIHKVRFDRPVPIRRRVEDVPEELERVLDQLLAKDPNDRVPTALALSKRLGAILHALSLPAAKPSPSQPAAASPAASADVSQQETLAGVPGPAGADQIVAAGGHADVRPPRDESAQAAVVPTTTKRRFVAVQPGHEKTEVAGSESRWLVAVKRLLLLAAILLVGWALWTMLAPPSAQTLLTRITAAAEDGTTALLAEESSVKEFLRRFPEHPFVSEVQAFQDEIDRARLESRLLRRLRRTGGAPLSLAEQALLTAMEHELTAPAKAIESFKGLITVFGNDPDASAGQQRCVKVAASRLARLRDQQQAAAQQHAAALRSRLEASVEQLATNPDRARATLEAIVQLYADQPWAADVVKDARAALATLDEQPSLQP